MNFIEAVKLAEKGKKIRRSKWASWEWLDYGDLNNKLFYSYVWLDDSDKSLTEAFLAEDWEEYIESNIEPEEKENEK